MIGYSWATLTVVLLTVVALRRFRRRDIRNIRGPAAPSWLLGHQEMVIQTKVGELESEWVREYGATWRMKGCFGEDVLCTADPKALQYVFHTASYRFPKTVVANEVAKLFLGRGSLVSAAAEDHQRYRKFINPAFGISQLREFLPIFQRSASSLSQKWKDELVSDTSAEGSVINVLGTVAKMAMDAIGEVAFDYCFETLDGKEYALITAANDVLADSLLRSTPWELAFKGTWQYLPQSILSSLKHLPHEGYQRFLKYFASACQTGKGLIEQRALENEKGRRDMTSLLAQSNLSEKPSLRLSPDEMISQIVTVVGAHDVFATTFCWLLHDLAQHREDQQRIRDEIEAARAQLRARGGVDFTPADFDSMTFANAAIKESLRLHPGIPILFRMAEQDDILPLAQPIETTSGQTITEIPIAKGQSIATSIWSYNRLESVWGEDAHEWNPSRFLGDANKEKASVGLVANLLTFSGGVRGCIGWRFALLEGQAVLVELLENFAFHLPEETEVMQIFAAGGQTFPAAAVRGHIEKGIQMPLRVTLAR